MILRGGWVLAALLTACGAPPLAGPPGSAVEGLETTRVQVGDNGADRTWDGVVEAVRQATLSAQTHGRVAEVLHDVNDPVSAGTVLVRLTAVEQQADMDAARARLRAAEAAALEAEGNHRRYLDLARDQYVSRAQLDQARATRDAAVAARDAAGAQLAQAGQQTDYTTIRAPYAGVVGTRDVEPGESVGVGQRLATVFAPDALRIEVSMPQSEAEAIRLDPRAQAMLDDGRELAAVRVVVFPAADPLTHAVKVRVELPSVVPAPAPGSTARVGFGALKGPRYPQVPVSAVVRRGEVAAVYVLDGPRLSLRQLRLGQSRDDRVDVIAGLRPGEVVATDPVAALQALVAARAGGD